MNQAVIHHTAVSREENGEQFDAVQGYHKGKGWGDIGYHWFIEPDGQIKKGRVGRGAHVREGNVNGTHLGICLAGNFDKELPTDRQNASLINLLNTLGVENKDVYTHRHYADYKSCPGNMFTDHLIKKVLNARNLKSKIRKLVDKFLGNDGEINGQEMTILKRLASISKKLKFWQSQ